MTSRIHWFADSPPEGDSLCLCSWCAERIEDDEEDEFGQAGGCVRMWQKLPGQTLEARFHDRCLNEAIELGEINLRPPSERSDAE